MVRDEAYVNIMLSEDGRGNLFYDLSTTDVEDVNKNEGVSDTLPGARITNADGQGNGTLYRGRVQQTKEFVNHVNKENAGHGNYGSFSMRTEGRWNAFEDEMRSIRERAQAERGNRIMARPETELCVTFAI